MLQLSPELLAHLRSTQAAADEKLRQARGPWTPTLKAIPQAQAKRLNGDRRSRLVDIVMTVLKTGEPTHFAFEASCRHGLRGSLCLQGWNWHDADTVAAEIVETALRQIGAQRPTWQQGQPEWTQDGVLRVERDNCVRCRSLLPEGHRRYCSSMCASADQHARARATNAEAENARVYAYYAAWSAKQPEQPCEVCRDMFRPKRPGNRFCSILCRNRRNSGLVTTYRRPLKCEAVG